VTLNNHDPFEEVSSHDVSADHRKKIYEAARNATAGPWCLWDDGDVGTAYPIEVNSRPYRNRHSGAHVPASKEIVESQWIANSSHENGAYLALVDPQTIITLLKRIEYLEEKLQDYEK